MRKMDGKKLKLHRETIRYLNSKALRQAQGGTLELEGDSAIQASGCISCEITDRGC